MTLRHVAISSSAITVRFYSKQADNFEMPLHKLQEVAREVLGQDMHSQWHLRQAQWIRGIDVSFAQRFFKRLSRPSILRCFTVVLKRGMVAGN